MEDKTEELFGKAVAQFRAGRLEAAERLFGEVLALDAAHRHAHANLGATLSRQGRFELAQESFRRALELDPAFAEAWFNLGLNCHRRGEPAQAERVFRRALQCNAALRPAATQLGRCLIAQGKFEDAERHCRYFLSRRPEDAELLAILGRALLALGQHEAGIGCYQALVDLRPGDPARHHQLSLGWLECGRWEESITTARTALALKPDYAHAHNTLAIACEAGNDLASALRHGRESVRLDPKLAEGWNNLGNLLSRTGGIDEAVACFRRSLAIEPRASHIHGNLLLHLNYLDSISPEAVAAEHQQWADRFTVGVTPFASHRNDRSADRVLKVGLVSPDFREHTVMAFLEPLVEHVDRTRVRLYAYANVRREDAVSERVRGKVDAWRNIARMPDAAVANQIVADGIDILVDLAGHTAGNRLMVFALRPAPVQVTQFGYPNTSAVPAIRYRISDALADPPGLTEALYTETIYRIPGFAWCWQPPGDLPEPRRTTRERIVFGSLNNRVKINPAVISAWAKVLLACPGSVLRLLAGANETVPDETLQCFHAHGVVPERIEFLPRMKRREYFQAQGDLDIALDPFPYNGGVTTCDALWMGTPLLTVAGRSQVSRQGVSLLSNLGLEAWIAPDADALDALAANVIRKRERLDELRTSLRQRMRDSPIVDCVGYAARWEQAVRAMWSRWCEQPG